MYKDIHMVEYSSIRERFKGDILTRPKKMPLANDSL
jgi:hypothetical protein